MVDLAEIRIWGEFVGAVRWDSRQQLAYFEYDDNFITCLIKFDENRIISGGEGHKIIVWDYKDQERLKTLTCGDDYYDSHVYSLLKINNIQIAIGSFEKIHIFDVDKRILICSLYGHTASVKSLILLNDKYIVSGSEDKLIKVWRLDNLECVKTIDGHKDTINSIIAINDSQIISASVDKTIKVWNVVYLK